jgi:hypothetical protein
LQNSDDLEKFFDQLETQNKKIQGINNGFIAFLKEYQIVNYFMNTQAITNLLFGEFYLPPQSYEFIRLIGSTTYPEIPSWNKRTYHYIFPHNYTITSSTKSTFKLE